MPSRSKSKKDCYLLHPQSSRATQKIAPPQPPSCQQNHWSHISHQSHSHLSTEKYLPRDNGGLAEAGKKGPATGRKVTLSVRAMYWMMSVWWGSRSSWSMLSLAALCRWNWWRLGDPGWEQSYRWVGGRKSHLFNLHGTWHSKMRFQQATSLPQVIWCAWKPNAFPHTPESWISLHRDFGIS